MATDVQDTIQADTKVLVHLCNLHGGQFPGEIYHYCSTTKPILFILDGTQEEQEILKAYSLQFNRFYFCQNNVDSICDTINAICTDNKEWEKLDAFAPQKVVHQLLN